MARGIGGADNDLAQPRCREQHASVGSMRHNQGVITGQKFKVSTGISCSLLSGTRTYIEQNRLYALRPKVTNAHGGQSNHNFGIAVDVGLFLNGKYMTGANRTEDKAYADFAALVKRDVHDIEWGGDWVSFKDAPHYQYKTGKTLDEVRKLFEAGASFT